MCGLPFVTASLPHSPQLVQALTSVQSKSAASASAVGTPAATRHVAENRLTPLLMYLLLGMPLLFPSLLSGMPEARSRPPLPRANAPHLCPRPRPRPRPPPRPRPYPYLGPCPHRCPHGRPHRRPHALPFRHQAAIDGVLAFVGLEGILLTPLWQRTTLLLTPPDELPATLTALRPSRVHAFTIVQLAALALCWAVNLSPLGLCVSLVGPQPLQPLQPLQSLLQPLQPLQSLQASASPWSALRRRIWRHCPRRHSSPPACIPAYVAHTPPPGTPARLAGRRVPRTAAGTPLTAVLLCRRARCARRRRRPRALRSDGFEWSRVVRLKSNGGASGASPLAVDRPWREFGE